MHILIATKDVPTNQESKTQEKEKEKGKKKEEWGRGRRKKKRKKRGRKDNAKEIVNIAYVFYVHSMPEIKE